MHSINERPRELRWYHAGGLLFGDWGTSRLYVLGLAFYMSGHASFWYVAAMCLLVSLVGFSYTIICAKFPDGGGVYSAARARSKILAVVGALLLIADYTVTAALSTYEGFRYMLPSHVDKSYALWAAVGSILLMGGLNVIGPRRVGIAALGIAILSGVFFLILGIFCVVNVQDVKIVAPSEPIGMQWVHFSNVILALSGVEAIANMTGVMAEPVARNARRAIIAVLLEVVVLNLVMAYAMNGLPAFQNVTAESMHLPENRELAEDVRDHMVKILAHNYVGPTFAAISSVCFGLLLLSAANTAMGGMVSVMYLLARDKELPMTFSKLNRFGVPWVGLIVATALPAVVLVLVGPDATTLAGLYAIGVVGAIAINLNVCGTNFGLDLKKWERTTLLVVGVLMAAIEVTIAIQKPEALFFAIFIIGSGLGARVIAQKQMRAREAVPAEEREGKLPPELTAKAVIPSSMGRLLVPTRGHPKLLKFAINYAKDKKAAIFPLFVREVALAFRERGGTVQTESMNLAKDKEAQKIFADIRKACEEAGVPMVPLYAVHDNPSELILDHAATLGVDAVLMGVSKRGALWRTLKGDVLQEVVEYLPESIPLLIHA